MILFNWSRESISSNDASFFLNKLTFCSLVVLGLIERAVISPSVLPRYWMESLHLFDYLFRGFAGAFILCDGPADDDKIGTLLYRFLGSNDSLLVTVGRP